MITSLVEYLWRKILKECPADEAVLNTARVVHLVCIVLALIMDVEIIIKLF